MEERDMVEYIKNTPTKESGKFQPFLSQETFDTRILNYTPSGIHYMTIYSRASDNVTCTETRHGKPYEDNIREQHFSLNNNKHGSRTTWYPGGRNPRWAVKENYEHGALKGKRESQSDYIYSEEYYEHGKKTGVQSYYHYNTGLLENQFWVNGMQHGVQTEERHGKTVKEYYWCGEKVSQALWWIKENTQEIECAKDFLKPRTIGTLFQNLFKSNVNQPTPKLN